VREVNQTMRTLADSGMTMIISTHDIAFAETVADRIVFLQNGQLVEEGEPSRLRAPQTDALAAFLRQERHHQPDRVTP
jgi:polar amino acid transport system permease protein